MSLLEINISNGAKSGILLSSRERKVRVTGRKYIYRNPIHKELNGSIPYLGKKIRVFDYSGLLLKEVLDIQLLIFIVGEFQMEVL